MSAGVDQINRFVIITKSYQVVRLFKRPGKLREMGFRKLALVSTVLFLTSSLVYLNILYLQNARVISGYFSLHLPNLRHFHVVTSGSRIPIHFYVKSEIGARCLRMLWESKIAFETESISS